MLNLNAVNDILIQEMADNQVVIDDTQTCSTLAMEVAHLNARGKDLVGLPQMATQLLGNMISRVADVVEEQEFTGYAVAPKGNKVTKYVQSLNASLKMVALHGVLLSGFTNAKTIETALEKWVEADSISLTLDYAEVALDLLTAMIVGEVLNNETGKATTDDGAFFEAHGVTEQINDLRVLTMRNLWKRAQPRMQPMKHKITWRADFKGNAVCEIPNLKLVNGKSTVTLDFIKAANNASHTGYMINSAIRTELDLWLELGEMPELPEDEVEALKAVNKYEDKVNIVEELMLLPMNQTMYFPHTADWRGRFYARGGLTQFQSIKECKAIFDFSNYVQVTDPKGLYLHVANAHGMDKFSITDRVKWVRDNMQEILAGGLANDVYAKRSALALAEYTETGETNVICHIDGTCNGTQWTATMFRDAKTAKLVNCLASTLTDVPFDLYGVIAERASKLATGNEKAAILKFMRDLTKAPIMVLGYGASENTILDTVTEFLLGHGNKANPKKVVKAIMTAIKLEAPALTKLTTNLKRILKATPRNTLTWNAFDLEVRAESWNSEELNLHGSSYTAKLKGEAVTDNDALSRGISPNYVHSMDSAHLRAVIRKASCYLSCIHDSVGCPANKVLEINELIRREFHEINKTDLIENIYNALEANYTPQMGTMNIDDVLEATYIFS